MIAPVYALGKFVSWLVLRTIWRLRVTGVERVPRSGPLIVACNHVSYLDPPALGAAAPRPLVYMAKSELFRIPVFGPLIRALGAFPIERGRGDIAALKAAAGVLEDGAALGIFPEGTRNLSGDVKPQMGVALLAMRSGATVVPAYVGGTARTAGFKRIVVAFGEPLRFEGNGKATRAELAKWTEELMRRIYGLRETTLGN